MKIIKLFIAIFLILHSCESWSGSDDINVNRINQIANVYDFLTNDDIYVSVSSSDKIVAYGYQYCHSNQNASCQNYSGVNVVQVASNGSQRQHKIVSVVTGDGDVQSSSHQYVPNNHSSIQSCAGISCVQVMNAK